MQPCKVRQIAFLKNIYSISWIQWCGSKKPSHATVPLTHYLPDGAHAVLAVFLPLLLCGEVSPTARTVSLTHYTWRCACCSGSVPSSPPRWGSVARSGGRRRCGPARGQSPPALTSPPSEAATASSRALKDFLRLIIAWRKWSFRHWLFGHDPAVDRVGGGPPQIYPHP